MKIDFIVPYDLLDEDSRSNSLIQLSKNMVDKGLNVYIFCPFSDIPVKNKSLSIKQSFFDNYVIGNFLLNFIYIYNYVKRNPDFVVYRPDSGLIWSILLLPKDRLVFNIHSIIEEEARYLSWKHFFIIYLATFFRNISLKKVYKLIVNHNALRDYFRNINSDYIIKTIYNGANTHDFYKIKDIKSGNHVCSSLVSSQTYNCVFVGNVSIWHGLEEVALFFDRYNKKTAGKKIKLIIVGLCSSKIGNTLRSYNFITLVGKQPKRIANILLNLSDFAVVNVTGDRTSPGSPIKLFDYMASNTPILTKSNVEGYSDIVEKYKIGIAIDFAVDTEIDRLQHFLLNIDSIDSASFDKAIEDYSWSSQANKWISFFRSIK